MALTTVSFDVDQSVYDDAQTKLRAMYDNPTKTTEEFCSDYLKKIARTQRESCAITTAVESIDTTGL